MLVARRSARRLNNRPNATTGRNNRPKNRHRNKPLKCASPTKDRAGNAMFDPRDFASDPRTPGPRTKDKRRDTRRNHAKEREDRERDGHRREYDPRGTKRQAFQDRTDRAVADVGMYRNVAYRDVVDAHFEGHPYTARRAVDQMVRAGHVREHTAQGPQGGNYKVLTLTERGVERAERVARDQGLDSQQKAWSGLVKPRELQHDVAVFRAARIEQMKLLEQGATIKRVRIDAELKREIASATESARARGGKEAADAARLEAAEALGLAVKDSRVEYPDAQLEYLDVEGRSGRVNVEVATEHYSAKSIAAKAAAGFAVHGSNGRRRRGSPDPSAKTRAAAAAAAAHEIKGPSNSKQEIRKCSRGKSVLASRSSSLPSRE